MPPLDTSLFATNKCSTEINSWIVYMSYTIVYKKCRINLRARYNTVVKQCFPFSTWRKLWTKILLCTNCVVFYGTRVQTSNRLCEWFESTTIECTVTGKYHCNSMTQHTAIYLFRPLCYDGTLIFRQH